MKRTPNLTFLLLLAFFSFSLPRSLEAQDNDNMKLRVTPEKLTLKMGQQATVEAAVFDGDRKLENEEIYFFSRDPKIAEVDSTGLVTPHQPGLAQIIVIKPHPDGKYLRQDVEVEIKFPPPSRISLANIPDYLYTGISRPVEAKVFDELGFEHKDQPVRITSSDEKIASVDELNILTGHKKGKVKITAAYEGIATEQEVEIRSNPVAALEMEAGFREALTGDVIPFTVKAFDKKGEPVGDVPLSFSFTGVSDDPSFFASGLIENDGRFVAYEAGAYTVTVSCGNAAARQTVKVRPRQEVIKRDITLVGRGAVTDKHTSDLWVWEGVDGRDYAVTGTWGADGEAFFWDVTDPANMIPIDTVKVDARTVNDVKISEDGRICVISREGASNRKNGIIILDVVNPKEVWILSEFTEGLTGGVHNLFIYKDHVYALSNGERYDVINIEDPANPKKVGTFELGTPGHAIHDVWIVDGLAYSSNWHDGVQIVDVGNGMAGGTPSNPVKVGSYAYPSGWNHAAFPFLSPSTGKFYVIAGDEAFPNGLYIKDKPTIPAGYLHVIDFTDMDNPREVARYEVPGAGSHNFWIEGETLYVANYNGGLRVVDISGDLMGDLYRQGREIGWFLPTDSKGVVPNAPMTWGPQPHKGRIFFSDWNSGLWSVKMEEKKVEN